MHSGSRPNEKCEKPPEVEEETALQMLLELPAGEKIYRQDRSIVVKLPARRRTLTTSWLNGGYREDLECIINNQIPRGVKKGEELEGGDVSAYLSLLAAKLGFNPLKSTGMLTAANMMNVAIVSKGFRGLEVTAIITGGVEINGGRVGDPASYYQENGSHFPLNGTINIIIVINADLPEYTMSRVIMTATEAKTAALQELMVPSRYSEGIATGSGTDMIAVVCDMTSPLKLTDAGKHSKLGELIGKCVIEATKRALEKQSELTPISQRNMLLRLERFGVDEAYCWNVASHMAGDNRKMRFLKDLRELAVNPLLVAATSAITHLVDEVSWGLLPETSAREAALALIRQLPDILQSNQKPPENLLNDYDSIIDNLVYMTAWLVKNGTMGEKWS
ncbi:MAG: Adenosylcobinamide amidohydrolase [Methanomethylovorans sp. PtaU1.Bin093]|uniref:adenosylcobinamide amidohydrolase n=1 Tax=Methanomethylovorans sp. PtaU1.Bin093 TaxID=1811679 RepID=UPI0009C688BC|nr:adenosylcobinamide amidohydrolase [Methanomethylovorans sp. PtaU1.Bin093]OPY20242.1 MAG: Adenosylcobinamide amidohydrolase [Methanomethylovorans sp. PtaU1.Bin093]